MKKLPIGIQDFEKIRTGDYLYVDKTEVYYNVFNNGVFYFLSRPRRFGKSLMLSTVKYLYQGKKELFKGLWIEDKWDWDKTYPVIYIDLSAINTRKSTLEIGLMSQIKMNADLYDVSLSFNDAASCFYQLIHELGSGSEKCVILVDEYDKPITDYINEPEISGQHVAELKAFYGVLKSSDNFIHKTIISGVSKYGKVSIFSELNNLADLTLSTDSNTICGYTQADLEHYFTEYFPGLMQEYQLSEKELLSWIKNWYNGYSWNGKAEETLYNPFSILKLFYYRRFANYWFETGTPSFLTHLLARDKIRPEQLEQLTTQETIFFSSDLYNLDVISLLVQTGYLTIKKVILHPSQTRFILAYPNTEVRLSFTNYILAEYMHVSATSIGTDIVINLQNALWEKNWTLFFEKINQVFAAVPYKLFNNNEAYYHSLVHVMLTLTGHLVLSELMSNKGRIDTVLETDDFIVIFEFKMDSSAEAALNQIHEKNYAERYKLNNKEILFAGVNFDSGKRSVVDWKIE